MCIVALRRSSIVKVFSSSPTGWPLDGGKRKCDTEIDIWRRIQCYKPRDISTILGQTSGIIHAYTLWLSSVAQEHG